LRFFDIPRWNLWSQPTYRKWYLAAVELAAVTVTVCASAEAHWRPTDLWRAAGLLACGVLQAELARPVERARRRVSATPYINMTSVWTVAGVLSLPTGLISALIAFIYVHLAFRSYYRLERVPPFRTVFNASLVACTSFVAHSVLRLFPGTAFDRYPAGGGAGFLAIAATAATYFCIGALFTLPGLALCRSRWWGRDLFGSLDDNVLEATTIGLGAITAVLVVTVPPLTVAVIPCVLLLQRGALVKQLEIAASVDAKTEVLNTAAWRQAAEGVLARAAHDHPVSSLMIDLDRFKRINDRHGHLAGDAVLRAVAAAISAEIRSTDLVGRFGGEEFVVLAPRAAADEVSGIAERIRCAVAELTVALPDGRTVGNFSVSVGVAVRVATETTVEELLQAADEAMYAAKHRGRNRVVVADAA
jgi:diguanylate cyclase (GGDEF)-like protein